MDFFKNTQNNMVKKQLFKDFYYMEHDFLNSCVSPIYIF